MVDWKLAMNSVIIGLILAGLFNAIGWWVKNIVQRRRDAADVAKTIYNSMERTGEAETQGIKDIETANVERYGKIYRALLRELRKRQ